ncbi:acyl carrier protein [Streptomyces triticisoli]|jgi:acyl carrier protein|uniref:acyl carrier protein n=1 Tax=Streptomyces triticisoli TaxID=2182797 RepID=UPI000DD8652D|nr:acyl carrier protein [Streptomyces triticisoli]
MDETEARTVVEEALTRAVPGADLTGLAPDTPFRDALELDSLDFLSFVETLSERTGLRIDEEDYPRLTALHDATEFLVARAR